MKKDYVYSPYLLINAALIENNGKDYLKKMLLAMLRDERKEKLEKLGWR